MKTDQRECVPRAIREEFLASAILPPPGPDFRPEKQRLEVRARQLAVSDPQILVIHLRNENWQDHLEAETALEIRVIDVIPNQWLEVFYLLGHRVQDLGGLERPEPIGLAGSRASGNPPG